MGTQLAGAVESDILEMVVKALERSEKPLVPSKVREALAGPYRLPEKRLEPLLEELAAQGRVHRFEPERKGGKPRYLDRDLDQYAREVILDALAAEPKTRSELKKKRTSKLKELPEPRFTRIVDELQASGQIHRVPPLGKKKTEQLSTRKPDLRVYVDEALRNLSQKLARWGVTPEEVNEAGRRLLLPDATSAPPERATIPTAETPAVERRAETVKALPPSDEKDLALRILERMSHINPAAVNGALISLRDLRRSMEFQGLDKPAFDRAVLRLAAQGRVALHRHDYAAGLSDEEKAELIPDGRGGYYVGIAQRV